MKALISVLAPSALLVGLVAGCGSPQPPAELRDARVAYSRAEQGPAAQTNRAGLMEARQALDSAERKYSKSPDSDDVKTLAYVAERKAETAEADGRAAAAKTQEQQAENKYLQLQTQQAQAQAGRSERRAKIALDRLGLAAKEEARGTVVTLPTTNMFATNSAEIMPAAKARLAEVADAVKKVVAEGAAADVGRKIQLIGYTDSTGSDQHNMDLSKRRADAVMTFFAQHGVDRSMMETDGRGEADPIADNGTKQGRSENRRVEVIISPSSAGGGMKTPPTEEPKK